MSHQVNGKSSADNVMSRLRLRGCEKVKKRKAGVTRSRGVTQGQKVQGVTTDSQGRPSKETVQTFAQFKV